MMNYYLLLGLLTFSIGFLSFITRSKHIITMLLSLEMMALSVFICLSATLLIKGNEDFILIPFLTMVVCEGSLGLSLLVMMTRFMGNDLVKSTNLLKS